MYYYNFLGTVKAEQLDLRLIWLDHGPSVHMRADLQCPLIFPFGLYELTDTIFHVTVVCNLFFLSAGC